MARGSHDAGPTDPTGGMSMMEPFEAVKHAQVKIAQLSADNAALRREAHTLRTQLRVERESHLVIDARERAAETTSRTDALRHLAAAEDHVALLLSESKGRLDAMAAESDRAAGGGEGRRMGGRLAGSLDDDERRELELLRVEVREHVNVRAEMDAEAEEREEELREAYAHVKRLQEAARIAA